MNKNFKKLLPGVRENVSLKNHNTFKIGGKARYFFVATKKEELIKSVNLAKNFKLPLFILGNGSNLLISDKGFKGLIIKAQMIKTKCQNNTIYAEAGVTLGQLVIVASENNLTGLEWAAGIPGTLGGAIYGNAGAFGKSMADITKTVTVLEIPNPNFPGRKTASPEGCFPNKSKIKIFKYSDCKFGYRDSIFKKKKNLVILSAKIELKRSDKKEIRDKIKQKMRTYLNHRIETQPLNFPSIGSIFKNPKGFFAAELIEKCGLKGKKIGDVKISEKHANFIINLGKGKARDVVKLINIIKKKVKEKFWVNLEEEIIYLGF